MNWRLFCGGRSTVRNVPCAALGRAESLEGRQFLSVSPTGGIESNAVRQIEWQWRAVEVHADPWIGRFDAAGGQGSMPAVLPTTMWKR